MTLTQMDAVLHKIKQYQNKIPPFKLPEFTALLQNGYLPFHTSLLNLNPFDLIASADV